MSISEKLEYLDTYSADTIYSQLLKNNISACSPDDVSGADKPTHHFFEHTDVRYIYHYARRMASKHNKLLEKKVRKMLDSSIIVPPFSAWSISVVIATKKNGKTRFCINHRVLNQVIKADRWPPPKIEEIFDELESSNVFSTLDLFSGYWQINMDDSCKEQTIFVTRSGMYQFEVMPFALMDVPRIFQDMMDGILDRISSARTYLDDVLIYSWSLLEHMGHLRQLFKLVSQHHLKLKFANC